MKRRRFVAVTSIAVTSAGLAGCAGDDGADGAGGDNETNGGMGDETTTDGDTEMTTDGDTETTTDGQGESGSLNLHGEVGEVSEFVEMLEHEAFRTEEDIGVTGVVENVAGGALDYVEVEVTLNDGDTLIGEFIDTNDEEIDSLASGERWRFWTTFEDEEPTGDTTYTIDVDAEQAEGADDGAQTTTTTAY